MTDALQSAIASLKAEEPTYDGILVSRHTMHEIEVQAGPTPPDTIAPRTLLGLRIYANDHMPDNMMCLVRHGEVVKLIRLDAA